MSISEEPPPAEAADGTGQMMARLSDEMVKLYKEQFGRGPTRVRSHFAGPDTVIVVLENTFTPAERNLASMGEHQRLRDTRLFFQYATENSMTTMVERIVERRVRAFISGIDTTKDISSEVFVLEPRA
jgi:uncharacterized protein YbcI